MSYQDRVGSWMQKCFGAEISASKQERSHRFIEEALELVQASGCSRAEAHMLVDYVFDRPVGDPHQEAGGVMLSLAALCGASRLDMNRAGEDELRRVWTKIEQIREKQARKPRGPLPQHVERSYGFPYTCVSCSVEITGGTCIGPECLKCQVEKYGVTETMKRNS